LLAPGEGFKGPAISVLRYLFVLFMRTDAVVQPPTAVAVPTQSSDIRLLWLLRQPASIPAPAVCTAFLSTVIIDMINREKLALRFTTACTNRPVDFEQCISNTVVLVASRRSMQTSFVLPHVVPTPLTILPHVVAPLLARRSIGTFKPRSKVPAWPAMGRPHSKFRKRFPLMASGTTSPVAIDLFRAWMALSCSIVPVIRCDACSTVRIPICCAVSFVMDKAEVID
jgi:hypothetical protein